MLSVFIHFQARSIFPSPPKEHFIQQLLPDLQSREQLCYETSYSAGDTQSRCLVVACVSGCDVVFLFDGSISLVPNLQAELNFAVGIVTYFNQFISTGQMVKSDTELICT